MSITVVEPRAELGYGLAYSSRDPDHRLNGTPTVHLIDPADPQEFERWYVREKLLARDPDATAPGGSIFFRRREFGRFVSEAVHAHANGRDARSSIRHLRDRAVHASRREGSFVIATEGGSQLDAGLLIVATGNAPPALPPPFVGDLTRHPAIVDAPFARDRMRAIDPVARVLVVGTGLTALDAITTLVQSGHRGPIVAVSRRGLRPRPQRPPGDPVPGTPTLSERIDGPIPPFVRQCGSRVSGRRLLRAIRSHAREVEAAGDTWHAAFDEFRDILWQVWTRIECVEKKRILRHARAWYDVHRFRAPPQNDSIVREAERQGRVMFRAARILSAVATPGGRAIELRLAPRGSEAAQVEPFDAIINCVGLDPAAGVASNPLLRALVDEGLLTRDATGVGFAVDEACRAIGSNGEACDRIRVIGPPTAGVFGDPLGAIFIAGQIRRALSGMLVRGGDAVAPYNLP